jgi:hypothetical protein
MSGNHQGVFNFLMVSVLIVRRCYAVRLEFTAIQNDLFGVSMELIMRLYRTNISASPFNLIAPPQPRTWMSTEKNSEKSLSVM